MLNCRENEKSLRCRSENPILAGSVIENVITLQVSCEYNSSENIFQTNPNLDPKTFFKLIQIWITLRVTSTISPNRENCPNLGEMSASRNYLSGTLFKGNIWQNKKTLDWMKSKATPNKFEEFCET